MKFEIQNSSLTELRPLVMTPEVIGKDRWGSVSLN